MTEKTLPEGPPMELEAGTLRPLVVKAMRAILRDLSATPIPVMIQAVYRSEGGDVRGEDLGVPAYHAAAAIQKAPESDEARRFADYLWSRNAPKKTLICDSGEPGRSGWESFIFAEHLTSPLLFLLARSATADLANTGSYRPWAVDDEELDLVVADIVARLCGGEMFVEVIAPLLALTLEDPVSFELEPDVVLEAWSGPTKSLFLTRYHRAYLSTDMAAWASNSFLRSRLRLKTAADPLESVAAILDRVKWALMAAVGHDGIVMEGGTIVRSWNGEYRRTLRRADNILDGGSRSYRGLRPNLGMLQGARDLLARLSAATSCCPAMKSVLWAFGRSCVAQLPRDVLLEAAIGLEMLLVSGQGESTYKFTLHGQAVLAHLLTDGHVGAELGRIYGLRSRAAHGADANAPEFKETASRARFLLAKAIQGILDLSDSGEIDLAHTKEGIGNAVKAMVATRVRRTQVGKTSS